MAKLLAYKKPDSVYKAEITIKEVQMKEGIHPKYEAVNVQCVCGAVYPTRSTITLEKIDICAACHPFYTGKTKVLDTEGRIEKFKKKFGTDYANKAKK